MAPCYQASSYLLKFLFICIVYLVPFGGNIYGSGSIMEHYILTADQYLRSYDFNKVKLYLDSASFYEKKVTDPEVLGYFYGIRGEYYSFKMNDVESHKNFYKAIECYKKAGKESWEIPIYHNLAFSYIQKRDTSNLKKIIGRMQPLALKHGSQNDIINTFRIMAFYYNCLYDKNKEQSIFLDSAIYYDKKIISIYAKSDTTQLKTDDYAYSYVDLASNLLKTKQYNPDSINSYLAQAEKLSNPTDTAMMINIYCIRGELAYQKMNFKEAAQIFKRQLSLMDEWRKEADLSLYVDVCDRLSKISEIENDHVSALAYEREKSEYQSKINDNEKYLTINELREKYEADQREQEIKQLQAINQFREKINLLSLAIFILSMITFFFVFRWLQSKKKAADSQLQLIRMEKKEMELQARLKEEQLKKIELEKYEALLGNHFKDLRISEMDDVLIELRNEQIHLNKQVRIYAEKLQKYEQNKGQRLMATIEDSYFYNIANDVYALIMKKLKEVDKHKDYIEALKSLNDTFFQNLKNECKNELSATNIKYCICSVIDMDIQHIADCFCVELRSVHMVRHRLRAKLNMSKETDLNTYLKRLIGW